MDKRSLLDWFLGALLITTLLLLATGCCEKVDPANKPSLNPGDVVSLVSNVDNPIGHVTKVYDYFGEWRVSVRLISNNEVVEFRSVELMVNRSSSHRRR